MFTIYQYINKINGHMYIGMTNNIKRRFSEHYHSATNPRSKDYNCILSLRKFVNTEECYVGYGTLWKMINNPNFYEEK